MASVLRKGDLYRAAIITGPRHALLCLKFAASEVDVVEVVKLPPVDEHDHGEIDENKLVEVVTEVAGQYGLFVRYVEYVEKDTSSYDLYRRCARLIAEYMMAERA